MWSIIGLAVRMAVGLGLHKKLDVGVTESQHASFLDTRRRVFWALYNLDRLVAFTMARPQGIHDEDIDIEVGAGRKRQELLPENHLLVASVSHVRQLGPGSDFSVRLPAVLEPP